MSIALKMINLATKTWRICQLDRSDSDKRSSRLTDVLVTFMFSVVTKNKQTRVSRQV